MKKKIKWIVLSLLILFVAAGTIVIVKNYPKYEKTKQAVYNLISDMDKGTFRRKGNTYIYEKTIEKLEKLEMKNIYIKSPQKSLII